LRKHHAVPEIQAKRGDNWSGCSIQGVARMQNSDAMAVTDSGPCRAFAVADGVGSMEASPTASRTAADTAIAWVRAHADISLEDVPGMLAAVNDAVGSALQGDAGAGATTLACAIVTTDRTIVATIGDSEALAVDLDGPARRLNELDHLPGRPNMLLAWIDGEAEFDPHVIALDVIPHRLCLLTDGVVKVLDYETIAAIIRGASLPDSAQALVMAARDAGASDDVTALVLGGV
jgi:serine/threonine protein phosphatase PrpC